NLLDSLLAGCSSPVHSLWVIDARLDLRRAGCPVGGVVARRSVSTLTRALGVASAVVDAGVVLAFVGDRLVRLVCPTGARHGHAGAGIADSAVHAAAWQATTSRALAVEPGSASRRSARVPRSRAPGSAACVLATARL